MWKCHNETFCIDIINKQKCLLSKMEDRKVNRSCLGVGTSGRGKDISKMCRRVNMVKILYTHV
jgi:hypothetical protein